MDSFWLHHLELKRKGNITDSSLIRTHDHLVRKQTLNHLAKLAKHDINVQLKINTFL